MKQHRDSKVVILPVGRAVRSADAPRGDEPRHEGPRQDSKPSGEALVKSREHLLSLQSADGWWVFELEADATIPSEYVMLQRFLDRPLNPELARRLERYLVSRQQPDGGWALHAEDGYVDLSASVKAYLALKLLGRGLNDPVMIRARRMILSLGGAARCNVFTRIALALFGQMPWDAPPAMPIEIMLLPRWFFFHLDKVSYWSRTVIVPLLILYAKQPVCRLRPEEAIPELFVTPPDKLGPLDPFVPGLWRRNAFILLDRVLKAHQRRIPAAIRQTAIKRAERWTRSHMHGEGGIGAIFPAMANAVMALRVLGHGDDDPDYARGLKAVDDLLLERCGHSGGRGPFDGGPTLGAVGDGSAAPELDAPGLAELAGEQATCQPCNSPIWDTCLSLSALIEAGLTGSHPAVRRAVDWLFRKQIHVKGDWASKAPDLDSGGWAFQFENTLYPDVDDTAMVVMALVRAGCMENPEQRALVAKAVNWIVGMQNSDGGWGAFDIDNNAVYLNDIPFADHGALLDPSTSDLTGRCVEMFGMLGYTMDFPPVARAIEFLRREQEEHGGWFGRWGVNYIYGTWSVLVGLGRIGLSPDDPMPRRGAEFLKRHQNPDGGWGETCYTYSDPSLAGQGATTASQTAWALLGLMAAGEERSIAVQRGLRWLHEHQTAQGGWVERHFTGTGFPRVFYLRYHGYSLYFPLWAMGVHQQLLADPRHMTGPISACASEVSLPALHKSRRNGTGELPRFVLRTLSDRLRKGLVPRRGAALPKSPEPPRDE